MPQLQKGFIQMPVLITLVVGLIFIAGSGYFGIKEYKKYQIKKSAGFVFAEEKHTSESTQIKKQIISVDAKEKDINILKNSEGSENIEITKEQTEPKTQTITQEESENSKNTYIKSEINDFLNDPTLENFKIFCDKVKNIQSTQFKEVLNSDRSAMEKISLTIYEITPSCKYFGDYFNQLNIPPEESGVYFVVSDQNKMVSFKDSDTDYVRRRKIQFNDKLKTYNQNYKFYRFFSPVSKSGDIIESFEVLEKYYMDSSERPKIYIDILERSITAPEQEVRDLLTNL